MARDVDVREVLPSIRVPTLVLHLARYADESRYVADRIPGARRLEIAGENTMFFIAPGFADQDERFVTGVWGGAEPETVLSTVLFTDIVASTQKAAEVGDRRWAELVASHHALVRRQLDRFAGVSSILPETDLRQLRRAGARDPLRARDQRVRPRARAGGARGSPHGRV